jgi:hypothetical protein
VTTYNGNYLYNDSTINYSGTTGVATQKGRTLQWHMNRLAGTLDSFGVPTLDAQGAANLWANTTGLGIVGALNVKAAIFDPANYLELQGILNYLAGTSGFGENEAASRIEA